MGLLGYYQRFIEGFLKIANPITELQKKKKKFVWMEKCVEAFRRLKELLTIALILKVPVLRTKHQYSIQKPLENYSTP